MKQDYAECLIQTRVPGKVKAFIKKASQEESITPTAYVRRLLLQHMVANSTGAVAVKGKK